MRTGWMGFKGRSVPKPPLQLFISVGSILVHKEQSRKEQVYFSISGLHIIKSPYLG